jgi:hypothetical protein
VHVDVECVGRHLDEQVDFGTPLLDRGLAVGIDDRVRDRLILHDPAVDEQILRSARRSLLGEGRDEARDPHAAGLLAHFHQIVPFPVHLI